MTSTTADKTAKTSKSNKDITAAESAAADIEIDVKEKQNREDLHYYYSSGSFNFILERGFKPETLEQTSLTKVPFLPTWYQGIISIHGLIVPVIDILLFAKSENLKVEDNSNSKEYLLKLEHPNHQPIVMKLDNIPKLVNMKKLKEVKRDNNSPDWIENYLENDEVKIASVDHDKLFNKLITNQ